MTNYFRKPDALVDAVRSILSGQPTETQEDIQRKSDVKMVKVKLPDGHMVMRRERPKIDIGKGKNESLDPVDQKALKGKHSDRKDKDIDNDGDVDSSDEYLHKRRKAVSKAMKEGVVLGEAKTDAYHKEMLKALGKSKLPKGHQYTSAVASNGDFVVYDGGKRIVGRLKKGEHSIKEGVEDNPANTQHLCAKNVVHENWGEGSCIPTMHADPDEDGNIEWYDVMFDHGIEEQVSIEELKVTKAESHMHSSKKKIKESKDEYEDDDDDSDEDEKNGKKKKVSGKKDDVDVEPEMDDTKMVTEKEMTPAQEKKREEIVLSMKKEMPRFKKKYGDRAKDVMYATATKMAMKEGFELGIEKSDLIEEVGLDEAKIAKKVPAKDGGHFVVLHRDTSGMRGTQDKFHMRHHLKNGKVKDYGSHPSMDGALKFAKNRGIIEEVELDEAKNYEIKNGKIHISKANFRKVHKDYKNSTKGKERMMALDPKSGATTSYEVVFEEADLDEAKMSASQIAALKKAYEPMRGKKISMDSGNKLRSIMDKIDDDKQALIQLVKADIPFVSALAVTRLISKHDMKGAEINKLKEEVELDEGRGRPRKDGTTGGSEDREHIQMQLRKSVSLRGLKDVEFDDGKKVKVPAKVAQGVMSKINSIKDAKQKQNAVQHIAKSHKHMMDFHKGDYKDADAKRQDILKLK